jgi:hypothetical protein
MLPFKKEADMAFEWHGRDNGELVWEQQITRYYFISGEEIITKTPHGESAPIKIGTRLKLTKSEAHKFFKQGYVEYKTVTWNEKTDRYDRITVPLAKGTIGKDIETRYLKQSPCTQEEVSPRKKKLANPTEP